MMTGWWRYGVIFCNSYMLFGVYFAYEIPIALQNGILNSDLSYTGTNNISNLSGCKVCLGLGEVRYNMIFSVSRWASVILCLPSGLVIDRLGNGRSLILFSVMPLIGSVMFAMGATSHAPVTTPTYVMMVAGFSLIAFGDGPLRFAQARVISHCFPEATFTALAMTSFGYCGQGISMLVAPYIDENVGFKPSVWLAAIVCGFGVVAAVVSTFFLQFQKPEVEEDVQSYKIMTFGELRALPGTYWLFIISMAFSSLSWLVPQANLPDYVRLRHGYTMIEVSHLIAVSYFMFLLAPPLCFILKKIDCDGILTTSVHLLMAVNCALWGFCPSVSIWVLSIADGIGLSLNTVMMWQLLVVLCPTCYVGTLGALMYFLRNAIAALAYALSGYILERQNMTDIEDVFDRYNHMFLVLVILSSTGVICGAVMNVLDTHKACALNSRIARWRQSNMETIGLISMTEQSNQYSDIDGINDNTVNKLASQ